MESKIRTIISTIHDNDTTTELVEEMFSQLILAATEEFKNRYYEETQSSIISRNEKSFNMISRGNGRIQFKLYLKLEYPTLLIYQDCINNKNWYIDELEKRRYDAVIESSYYMLIGEKNYHICSSSMGYMSGDISIIRRSNDPLHVTIWKRFKLKFDITTSEIFEMQLTDLMKHGTW